MLYTLHVKNWRSIRDQTIRFAEPDAETVGLKIFIGANASGKSNVLDALRLLHEAVQDNSLETAVTRRGDFSNLRFRSLSKDQDISIEMLVGVNWSSQSIGLTKPQVLEYLLPIQYFLEIGERDSIPGPAEERIERMTEGKLEEILNLAWGKGYTNSESLDVGSSSEPLVLEKSGSLALAETAVTANIPEVNGLKRYIDSWGFLDIDLHAIRKPQYPQVARELSPNAENLISVLRTLSRDDLERFHHIEDNLRLILGHVHSIATKVERGQIMLQMREEYFESDFDVRSLSDGTLRILAILTALETMPLHGLLAIEEPEHGIHPLLFGYLIDTIREYTESSQRQVFLTTHSVDLVNASDRPDEILIVERDEEGATVVRELDDDDLAQWREGFRLGQLWRMRQLGAVP